MLLKTISYFFFLALCAGVQLLASFGAIAQEPKPVRIGILAFRGNEEAEKSWGPTLAQLQRAMPEYRFELIPGSAQFLTTAVANHHLDFLITNPGQYLELEINYSARALATEQQMDGTATSESVAATIVVPAEASDIYQLSDFKGKRLAAVSTDAFGYRAALREFLARGIDPAKDTELLFVGFPVEGVLKAVFSGRADGGVVRSCLLEQLIKEGSLDPNVFRVVGQMPSRSLGCQVSTRLYPGWAFVKVAQTSPALASAIANKLLSLQPSEGEVAWTLPEDYSSVQDLYRALKIGPYAPFTRLGIFDFLWENRVLGAFVSMALLWWIFHALRVAHLLKKRTAELELAYETARVKGEQIEHAQRLSLMGEMASSLAHEINQPLAAILSYARGCERRISSGADLEIIRTGVERIAVQAERAGAIVRRMRDFVQKKPRRQVSSDLTAIVQDALMLFEPTVQNKNVTITTHIPDALCPVLADRVQIEEVLLNLLQNALEALGEWSGGRIEVGLESIENAFKVSVTDNGPGIAPDSVSLLFEAFFTTKADGLGLGLSLSRTIIEAHGGHLSVDIDQPGKTTFWFTLPKIEE
jgi:two-component system sensor histidine kinase TtrS